MLITSIFGLVTNISVMAVLGHSHGGAGGGDHKGHDHGGHGGHGGHGASVKKSDRKSSILIQTQQDSSSLTESLTSKDDLVAPKESSSMQAAKIHVIGDLIQNIGVFIASIVVFAGSDWAFDFNGEAAIEKLNPCSVADPVCTLMFAVLVLWTTCKSIGTNTNILMEGAPSDVNSVLLKKEIENSGG